VVVLMAVGPAVAQQEGPREKTAGEDRPGDARREGLPGFAGDREARLEMLRWAPEEVREVALLISPRVREELNLTDDQVQRARTAARGAAEAHREQFQELRKGTPRERFERFSKLSRTVSGAIMKELDGILTPEQSQRLEQLALQFAGPAALTDAEFRDKLNLTDDQENQLREIGKDFRKTVRALPRDLEDRDEARQKYRALWQETREKVDHILTSDQTAKWRELAGAPFDFDIRPHHEDDGDDDRVRDEGRPGDAGHRPPSEPNEDTP